VAHRALIFAALLSAACGSSRAAPQGASDTSNGPMAAPRPPPFATDDATWGRFHSKRFQLSVPLPDGRSWKIDDHSKPELHAVHASTSSRLVVLTENQEDLMNRHRCEARARARGYVPDAELTTLEDEVTTFPDAYDSRVWVALDAGKPGGGIEGHVFLFGAFLRRCLIVHLTTAVSSAKDDDVLSARLAIARARILGGLSLDPLRTTDDATVPRDRPSIRR
jgi:hypothetical protein